MFGASATDIAQMLTWQFTRPVLIAFLIASPLAYFAMSTYLQFFSDRVKMSPLFFAEVGLGAMLFTWMIVGYHTVRISRSNPSDALRYE